MTATRTKSVMVVLLTSTLLTVASCSGSSDTGDASSGEDTTGTTEHAQATSTDGASPASLPPDPAFDPLLPTLRQMTTASIMLPATLPPQLKSVAIGNDPNNQDSPDTTSGDRYTILFLNPDAYPPPDPTQIVQPYAHYKVSGTLTASPANAPPRPDPTSFGDGGATVYQLGNVALPDGTVANLKRVVPPEGANYVPFAVGTFEEGGERYTVMIENDSPEGDLVRQILSTMVKVPSA